MRVRPHERCNHETGQTTVAWLMSTLHRCKIWNRKSWNETCSSMPRDSKRTRWQEKNVVCSLRHARARRGNLRKSEQMRKHDGVMDVDAFMNTYRESNGEGKGDRSAEPTSANGPQIAQRSDVEKFPETAAHFFGDPFNVLTRNQSDNPLLHDSLRVSIPSEILLDGFDNFRVEGAEVQQVKSKTFVISRQRPIRQATRSACALHQSSQSSSHKRCLSPTV